MNWLEPKQIVSASALNLKPPRSEIKIKKGHP